jgi:competence protein ComEA
MVLYPRSQLLVLLALVATFGGGLAVDRWRRAHPEVVERLERFDRSGQEAAAAHAAEQAPARELTAAEQATGGEPEAPEGAPAREPRGPAPRIRAGPTAGASPPIDLNRATAHELTRLPGIGPALAARIVEARDAGPFAAVDDLRRVRGLGTAKLDRIRPLVAVNPP